MKRRRIPTKDERIAASLLMIKRGNDWLIPEPLRSSGDARSICAYVDWHHGVLPHAMDGDTSPQNITPLPTQEHKHETAKRTIPLVAKYKRLTRSQEDFRRRLLAKVGQGEPPPAKRRKWKPIPGSKNTPWKKHMDGRVSRR